MRQYTTTFARGNSSRSNSSRAPHPGSSAVRSRPDTSDAGLAVYDGRDRVGHVIRRSYGWTAHDRRRQLLGDFLSEREAVAAILAAAVSL